MAGHLVADLDWIDFVFGCSTVSQILCWAHRTRSVRRLDFGFQRKFQHHMKPHGVGFQKIQKLKKSIEGSIFL